MSSAKCPMAQAASCWKPMTSRWAAAWGRTEVRSEFLLWAGSNLVSPGPCALRREILAANGWSLLDLYRTLKTPDCRSSARAACKGWSGCEG